MKCYTIKVHTYQQPRITYERAELELVQVKLLTAILARAFQSIEVTNDFTGEVECQRYTSDNFFLPTTTVYEAIREAEAVIVHDDSHN